VRRRRGRRGCFRRSREGGRARDPAAAQQAAGGKEEHLLEAESAAIFFIARRRNSIAAQRTILNRRRLSKMDEDGIETRPSPAHRNSGDMKRCEDRPKIHSTTHDAVTDAGGTRGEEAAEGTSSESPLFIREKSMCIPRHIFLS